MFNEYEFAVNGDFSDINYDSSCFKPKSMLGVESKSLLKKYLQNPSVKYNISSRYVEEDEHELDWIEQIVQHFNKNEK